MNDQHTGHGASAKFRVVVDDQVLNLQEPIWTGQQLLELADRRPTEQFLLYQLGEHSLMEEIGLDESVDVRKPGIERFLTFRSDRSFRFLLNDQRQDWGVPKISETNLRRLAEVGHDFSIWFEPTEGEPRELQPGELVDLTGNEVERFHTERRITVHIVNEDNGEEIDLHGNRQLRIEHFIKLIYNRFKVERQPDDRLRCEEGGEDVFQFAHMTLGEYQDAGHCKCLVWLFASGTGGASCR